ncbi:MAG: ATP-binding protein [Planctomycetes bacterium]|nr:ATP-binding protein [Planctomycetota bacterium]
MIHTARFTNFKLLRDVEVPLGRFRVVVGANGAGKSSILDGLHFLLQLAGGRSEVDRARALFQGPRDPGLLVSRPGRSEFSLSVAGDRFRLFRLTGLRREGEEGFLFKLCFHGNEADSGPVEYPLGSDDPLLADLYEKTVALHLASVVRLRLDATQLAADHYSEERSPRVEYDGAGLASVLQEMLGARDGRFEAIERDLAKVVPDARRIRSTRARIVRREKVRISIDGQESWSEQRREYTGSGFEVDWGKVGWVPAGHLSEGTLLALGVVTVLHHRPPALILLDDIDKALHPTAQRELVGLLKAVAQDRPELQVLATTHSPYVVDEMAPEDVLVCASVDGLSSSVSRLSEHPKWFQQRPYLQPGEFWSATGESWVAEGRG